MNIKTNKTERRFKFKLKGTREHACETFIFQIMPSPQISLETNCENLINFLFPSNCVLGKD